MRWPCDAASHSLTRRVGRATFSGRTDRMEGTALMTVTLRRLLSAPLLVLLLGACVHSGLPGSPGSGAPSGGDRPSPALTGHAQALFVGHSAMNNVVDDYVATLARLADDANMLVTTQVTYGDISLVGKMDRAELDPVFREESHPFDVAVLTEQWDYETFYDPAVHGADPNDPVSGCPPDHYAYPAAWVNPPDDWNPLPYYLQQYVDALACGNPQSTVFYYQTWTTDYNAVTDGTTRTSNPNFRRPTIAEMDELIRSGNAMPDLPIADLIEFQGVKWERFVRAIRRPDVVFIPAGYAMAELLREVEAGEVPGFEALRETDGLTDEGRLAWVDWIFYHDGYHLSTVGHYFVSLVIYASVYNASPEGLPIGSGAFAVSEAFFEDQYPLEGISNDRYRALLAESGASGIYDLRGYGDLDYIHDDLRLYLQRLAWEAVTAMR